MQLYIFTPSSHRQAVSHPPEEPAGGVLNKRASVFIVLDRNVGMADKGGGDEDGGAWGKRMTRQRSQRMRWPPRSGSKSPSAVIAHQPQARQTSAGPRPQKGLAMKAPRAPAKPYAGEPFTQHAHCTVGDVFPLRHVAWGTAKHSNDAALPIDDRYFKSEGKSMECHGKQEREDVQSKPPEVHEALRAAECIHLFLGVVNAAESITEVGSGIRRGVCGLKRAVLRLAKTHPYRLRIAGGQACLIPLPVATRTRLGFVALLGGERGVRGGCWQGRRLSRWQLGGLGFHEVEVEVEVEAKVKLEIVGFVLLGKTSIFLSKALLDALHDIEVGCGLECAAKRKVECGIFLARTKGPAGERRGSCVVDQG
ncbi:hypothetical protein B0H14DRAFT_2583867 [Mycena olivaceomarginata]|nr:hypothetical protein B0H14DRAFT_2583867 [Mycena olivaceomarginata]